MTRTIVDPPGGWKYGFPAPIQEDYHAQLRDAGYPESEIETAMKHSRYWYDGTGSVGDVH